MSSPLTDNSPALLVLLLIVFILMVLFFTSYKSMKKKGAQNLSLFSKKIQQEQELYESLNTKVEFSKKKENSIKRNLMKIQLEIINIDFSTKEVINHLGNHYSS